MKQFKFLSLTSLLLLIFFSSCSTEDTSSIDIETNDSFDNLIEEMLCDHSGDDCDISILNDHVVLEDDMVFDKSELIAELENSTAPEQYKHMAPDGSGYLDNDPEAESRNRIANFWRYVSQTQATDITYRILPSLRDNGSCFDGWADAVRDAAQAYNNLGTKLNFREVSPIYEADITLGCDDDEFFNTTFDNRMPFFDIANTAKARVTNTNRTPGKYISVNNTSNSIRKKGIIIHEFGHTLGFKHTNTNDGVLVTCGNIENYTHNAASSVYRSVVNRNTFHSTDSRSVKQLWPTSLTTPINGTLTRLSNDWVKFTFKNNSHFAKPYTETVMAHLKNGVWQPARKWCDKPVDAVGNYTIYYWSPGAFTNGVQHFWMKGVSHGEEIHSGWEYLGGFNI